MTSQVPKTNTITINKFAEYEEFILWFATPYKVKEKMGLETYEQFADYWKISRRTLTRWKDRPDFEPRVRKLRNKWAFEKTMDVIQGMYQSAVKGNPLSQKLWLQAFEGFTEKSEVSSTQTVEIGENDLRFLIDGYPEPARTKFHGYITEIIDYGYALRHSREVAEDVWDDYRPADEILDESDRDASDIPSTGEDVVAESNSRRTHGYNASNGNRKTCASESNYQSTAWRREE